MKLRDWLEYIEPHHPSGAVSNGGIFVLSQGVIVGKYRLGHTLEAENCLRERIISIGELIKRLVENNLD